MVRLIVSLIVSFLLLTSAQAEWLPKYMNKAIDQTNFLVNAGCSGTLINLKERYILTAAHCVEEQYETVERDVIKPDGELKKEKYRRLVDGSVSQQSFVNGDKSVTMTYKVSLKEWDKDIDLAVVQVNGPIPNTQAAWFGIREPERGETIYSVGNPLGEMYSSVSKGIVSSTDRSNAYLGLADAPRTRLVQISSGVVGGNSGGALYNEDGGFVGVLVRANPRHAVIGFAIPLEVVRKFLVDKKLVD